MRLGVHLPQFRRHVGGGEVAAAARAAEAEGLDDVWVSDHLILPVGSRRPPEVFHEPLTLLAWAGAATERVRLGTSVLVVPYRPPIVLAKALASLDALSAGRVIAGVASGWHEAEFTALGVPYRERGARTDEGLAVCRALWAGEGSFAGRFTRFAGMRLAPGPSRPGGPPLWVGGNSRAGMRRAARIGAGWHTTIADPAELGAALAILDGELTGAGRRRADLTISVRVRLEVERVAELAPELTALGVDHLLVDPPARAEADLPGFLRRLRAAI